MKRLLKRVLIGIALLPLFLVLLAVAWGATARLFQTRRLVIYTMDWDYADRTGIAGDLAQARDGEPKIVLSRRVGQVMCYDALYSRGLKQYLDTQPHQPLPVTYLVTRRFGRPIFYQLVRVGTYSDATEADSGLTRVSPRDAYMSWPRGCE